MQVSVETPTKLKRRVTVTLPAEEFKSAFDKRIQKLSKTMKINGFRPGTKATENHIKDKYG